MQSANPVRRGTPYRRQRLPLSMLVGARKMPSDLDRAERWRALAAEALEVAKELTDPAANRIMIAIAEAYQRLAQRAEERNSPEESE